MAFGATNRTPIGSGRWRLLALLSQRWRLAERLLRSVGALARRFFPVVPFRNSVFVMRAEDVRSVLERPRDFSVALFEMRMSETIGLTFLGMDPSPRYDHESGALRRALEVPDPQRENPPPVPGPDGRGRLLWVRRFAADLSRRRVEEALKTRGEVDVVSDLANVVPLHFARQFSGTPEPDPDRPQILGWLKLISYYLFAPTANAWAVPARRAGRRLGAHFQHLVKQRKDDIAAGLDTPDDVLGRLIAAQGDPDGLHDEAIARTMGFISGAIMPTSWLFIEAVDRLLRLGPIRRQRLHRLALEGDEAGVRAYVMEAARFYPFPFVIVRYAEGDTHIGGRPVARGTKVNLVIASATMDAGVISHPGRFEPGRPKDSYLLFGHGMHLCGGKDIGEELMTQMAMALFSRRNLRRAAGVRGYLCKGPKGQLPEGYYPQSLIVKADG